MWSSIDFESNDVAFDLPQTSSNSFDFVDWITSIRMYRAVVRLTFTLGARHFRSRIYTTTFLPNSIQHHVNHFKYFSLFA
jgi:hypothetical protein